MFGPESKYKGIFLQKLSVILKMPLKGQNLDRENIVRIDK